MHGATAVGRRSGDRVVLPPTQYDKPANYAEVALRQHGDSEDEDGDEGGGTVLRSVALDDVPELQPPQRCPAVLKVDVETMELAVLAGAAQLLARCSAVTALYKFMQHEPPDPASTRSINLSFLSGYRCWHIRCF